jgi:hypothetical protein
MTRVGSDLMRSSESFRIAAASLLIRRQVARTADSVERLVHEAHVRRGFRFVGILLAVLIVKIRRVPRNVEPELVVAYFNRQALVDHESELFVEV